MAGVFVVVLLAGCHAQVRTDPGPWKPAPTTSQRFVVPVHEMALVSSLTPEDSCVPDPVDMGGQDPDAVWLLRFSLPWASNAVVERAVLTLHRPPPTSSSPHTVSAQLSVSQILEPWDAALVRYRRMPRLSARLAPLDPAVQPPDAPLRFDVTPIVRHWQTARSDAEGIAILSKGGAPWGSTCGAGTAFGLAPRLDLYLR